MKRGNDRLGICGYHDSVNKFLYDPLTFTNNYATFLNYFLKEIFPHYYIHSGISDSLKSSLKI